MAKICNQREVDRAPVKFKTFKLPTKTLCGLKFTQMQGLACDKYHILYKLVFIIYKDKIVF